ncbi:hypothetical protein [uncultured Oscillibacter sp.]|uniref:hypothetical protein n=1 Tax=uncultured Oscillibacter sp. TaxID=876091 RepID=UPI0025F74565|nr:hypothetical protein [uncultured Oscillibacter sp.]
MRADKISIRILALFCLYIYPVMLKGPSLVSYLYIYGIPFVYLCLHLRSFREVTLRQFAILAGSLILTFFSVLYPILHGTGDLSYVVVATFVFRKLVVYLFLCIVTAKAYKDAFQMEHLMLYFALTQCVFVLGTLAIVFVPGLKAAWFGVFRGAEEAEAFLKSFGYTFRIGWHGFSGFENTINCSIACIFLLYLRYRCDAGMRIGAKRFWSLYALCFLGNMFYGRSGLVVTMFASVAAVLVWERRDIPGLFKYLAAVLAGLAALVFIQKIPAFSDWFYWMSTPIKNLLTTGHFNNVSIQATSEGVVFPGMETFLLGDGRFTAGDGYYMQTDSGLMRNLYFWGILGSALAYGVTLCAIAVTKKKARLLYLMLLAAFAAFEYKGVVYCDFLAIFLAFSFAQNLKALYGRGSPAAEGPCMDRLRFEKISPVRGV